MQLYPLHETFYSWQGEGVHMGRAAFFIRLFGCPVHCPWCDSAGTWHPEFVPTKIEKVSVEQLVAAAKATKAEFAVITGGEPTIHDLSPLTDSLVAAGFSCHLETCGAFPIKGHFDWITLSPKWAALPLEENLVKASEFKLIVEEPESIEKWILELGTAIGDHRPVWLHPEWSKSTDAEVLESITKRVKDFGAPYRAGLQAHKYYRADTLDPNHRKDVPLGGNPELGAPA